MCAHGVYDMIFRGISTIKWFYTREHIIAKDHRQFTCYFLYIK